MKTVSDGAIEFLKSGEGRSIDGGYIPIEWFNAGYSFAKQWTDIKYEKPEYYLPVIVEGNMIVWRAWSESSGDIYTINGTDVVLREEPKRWRPI